MDIHTQPVTNVSPELSHVHRNVPLQGQTLSQVCWGVMKPARAVVKWLSLSPVSRTAFLQPRGGQPLPRHPL